MGADSRPDATKIDTINRFLVARQGDRTVIMLPAHARLLTDDEALSLAAWLVALTPDGADRFEAVYVAITNT